MDHIEAVPDTMVRVAIAGPMGSGKTSVALRFAGRRVPECVPPTLGSDVLSVTKVVDGKAVRVHMFDTAGQERFAPMANGFIRNKDVIVAAYDVTRPQTLAELAEHWAERLRRLRGEHTELVVIGCKADTSSTESGAGADSLAEESLLERFRSYFPDQRVRHFLTSALTGAGVDEAMMAAVRSAVRARARTASARSRGAVSLEVSRRHAADAAERPPRRYFLCFPIPVF